MEHIIRLLVATSNVSSSNSIYINSWGKSVKEYSQTSSGAPVAGGSEQVFKKYWHITFHRVSSGCMLRLIDLSYDAI